MYEHKVVNAMSKGKGGLEKELNKWAAQGWRVVTGCHMNTPVLEHQKS